MNMLSRKYRVTALLLSLVVLLSWLPFPWQLQTALAEDTDEQIEAEAELEAAADEDSDDEIAEVEAKENTDKEEGSAAKADKLKMEDNATEQVAEQSADEEKDEADEETSEDSSSEDSSSEDSTSEDQADADDEDDVLDPAEIYSRELLQFIPDKRDYPSYTEYASNFPDEPIAQESVPVKLAAYETDDESQVELDDAGLAMTERCAVSWQVEVPLTAWYELEITYKTLPGTGTAIERSLKIDGEIPFAQAERLVFRRVFKDENRDYKEDTGNQSFPSQVEVQRAQTVRLRDQDGYFTEPLSLYLTEGEHDLTLVGIKEPIKILAMSLEPSVETPSYEEYLAKVREQDPDVIIQSAIPEIEAEDASFKSSPSLYPLNDRTSPKTTPYHPTYVRLNSIGGAAWDKSGDWLSWTFDVPETGLYSLAIRYRQDINTGLPSTRKLWLNGEVPFEEAKHITFDYDTAWRVIEPSDEDGEPYLFYLEEGSNELRFEVTLDRFAELIYEVEESSTKLNDLAQDIVVITGSTPDPFRDYQLTERLPHLIPGLMAERDRLSDIVQAMHDIAGGRSDKTATIEKAILQIDDLIKKPREIAKKLTSLQSNITSLGDWALNVKSQSLTLDRMRFKGTDDPLPEEDGNFAENVTHEAKAFMGSFTNDPSRVSAGGGSGDAPELTVWVSTGRDQMDVIRRLLNEKFLSDSRVNLRLVSPAVALSATAAGRGPDVLIQTDSAQPIDFAFRGAGFDLTQFDDFDEVVSELHPAAVKAFEFEGGVYALPDQMSFPVLFYRSDILSDLQIPVPQTWEDILTIVPFLQNNHMEFFMEVQTMPTMGAATQATTKAINAIYLSMLYQMGGELYNEAGTKALTDSPEGIAAFEQWTDFYTKHSFPVSMNFVTRFRLGQVPLAIVNFTNYTTLSVSAPEIRGDWAIAPIPGTRMDDGSIRRDLPAVTSAAMMIKPMVEKHGTTEAAWAFLKWWVSQETQTAYAVEMESLLGSSARYPVANLESFKSSPWDVQSMDVLIKSLDDLREIRQVPGSYITGRNIENAFYEVVNEPEDANPRRTLVEWTENTNYEILSKRKEFGLFVEEGEE